MTTPMPLARFLAPMTAIALELADELMRRALERGAERMNNEQEPA